MVSMPRHPLDLVTAAVPDGLPLSGRIIRSGLGRAFGPPPFDLSATPGDPGLFGPASASWAIISEPAAIVGGIRALLVQLLHPLAMAGVADHSRFRNDALGRLQRTSSYVTATTFGALPEAFAATAAVRRAHRRVAGTAPDGRAYRADDPHLLAWVSVALTSGFLQAHRLYARPRLPAEVADRFVAEQSRASALLDPRVDLAALARDPDALDELRAGTLALPMLRDATLPQTVAELDVALREYAPEFEVNDQAREALRFLRWPDVPLPLRAGYLPLFAGAVASLERDQRRLLGLRMGGATRAVQAQTRATLVAMRVAAGASPALEAARRRAGAPSGPERGEASRLPA